MSQDALDRRARTQWSKEEKRKFAQLKAEQEETQTLQDPQTVKKYSSAFRAVVDAQLKALAPNRKQEPLKLFIDMETRSTVELKTRGVYVYAADPSTDVLCVAFQINDQEPRIWTNHKIFPGTCAPTVMAALNEAMQNATEIHAHNANFERVMWKFVMERYGFDPIPLSKWRCTAAKAAYFSLPRALGKACAVMNCSQQKDSTGSQVMLRMCKPNKQGEWVQDPIDFKTLCDYCIQDIKAERALDESLPAFPQDELEVWRLDQKINDRGVYVDLAAIDNLNFKIAYKEKQLLAEVIKITQGAVESVRQINATLQWMNDKHSIRLPDLTKRTVLMALEEPRLPAPVRRLLEIRQSLAKSSVSKLAAMRRLAGSDQRVRGSLLYHGAGTGRWAGKGIQPQNYPRTKLTEQDVKEILGLGVKGVEDKYGCVMQAASQCLRAMITAASGNMLLCADFASIEARVLAWVAKDEKILQAFEEGLDLYKVTAGDIFGKTYETIQPDERQLGKVAVLALGYQGWLGAFQTMAEVYDVIVEEEQAKSIILKWREAHPKIGWFWKNIEQAAMAAVKNPGKFYQYNGIVFGVRGRFLHCKLPSGRLLSYCDPATKIIKTKYDVEKEVVTFMGVDPYTGHWQTQTTYGGKLTENIVQAIARDLLVFAMQQTEAAGYRTVLHVHDEIVAEITQNTYNKNPVPAFSRLMSQIPTWAFGCPIGAEGWAGKRYKKQ